LARFQVERVGLPAGKVEVIHYGQDELPAPWGSNPSADVQAEARVLLAVCRLEPQKGLDIAVRALPEVRARHPKAELVVLGEGTQRSELERLASELQVPVHLLGRVPDVAAWLRRADLLVHPARWEGFGLALLEAMLASKPVVATNVSSIPEIVADSETGLLVAPDDPAALAAAVIRVLDDPGSYGEQGRRRAQSHFSAGRMTDHTLALYETALRGTGPGV
jgi:glycosyltransferase involved in cell wall biosynthesis